MNHMSKANLAIVAVGILCLGLTFGADAFAADRNACSREIAKFCPNIKPGMFALMDCLEKHEKKLTPACKEYEATLLGRRAEKREKVKELITFRNSCRNDMAKFCNDADPMHGGMIKCLEDHKKEISSSCSEGLRMIAE
jgi:hypothetical protein